MSIDSKPDVILADFEAGKVSRDFVTLHPNALGRVVVGEGKKQDVVGVMVGTRLPCLAEVMVEVASHAPQEILSDDVVVEALILRGLEMLEGEKQVGGKRGVICSGLDTYRIPIDFPAATEPTLLSA